MRKKLAKLELSPERKEHYSQLGKWLKSHPTIEFKKLPIGFSIDTRTIPSELVDEFVNISTFELWKKT
jgi:hypothetical protein